MRLNELYLIGALTISAIPLSAGAIAAQPAGLVVNQSSGQTAINAPHSTPDTDACPPEDYWEPAGYVEHGKFRSAHCAPRW
jgi:hypothetical protein